MPEGALHEDLSRTDAPKGSSDRSFGLVFAAVFAVIGLWPLLDGHGPRVWALAASVAFAALALLAPRALALPNRLWTRFGLLLARIVNPLVMGLLFYGVVTPMGLIMRACGKDPLRRRLEPEAASYWIERRPPGPVAMSRQF